MNRVICLLVISVYIAFAANTGEWVRTPVGLAHKSCVHEVPSGSHIEERDGLILVTLPGARQIKPIRPCGYQLQAKKKVGQYDGWMAYTTSQAANDYDAFVGYFSVPDAPQSAPEVLYLFTGLQNVNWIPIIDPPPQTFDIIQPVLQYPGDNGDYWSVKSWYVTLTNDVLYSSEIQVNTGDLIFGNMTKTGGDSTWYIGGTDSQSSQNTFLTVTRDVLLNQPWAYCTAECYGCQDCTTYPDNPIFFTKLQISLKGQTLTPSWQPSTSPNTLCHEQAVVTDPQTVTIYFQQQ
jgi:hypothetical protein